MCCTKQSDPNDALDQPLHFITLTLAPAPLFHFIGGRGVNGLYAVFGAR